MIDHHSFVHIFVATVVVVVTRGRVVEAEAIEDGIQKGSEKGGKKDEKSKGLMGRESWVRHANRPFGDGREESVRETQEVRRRGRGSEEERRRG